MLRMQLNVQPIEGPSVKLWKSNVIPPPAWLVRDLVLMKMPMRPWHTFPGGVEADYNTDEASGPHFLMGQG